MEQVLPSVVDGLTPLMIASFCGSGFSAARSTDEGDDLGGGSAAIITGLLSQGAAINAQTDRTGWWNVLLNFVCGLFF